MLDKTPERVGAVEVKVPVDDNCPLRFRQNLCLNKFCRILVALLQLWKKIFFRLDARPVNGRISKPNFNALVWRETLVDPSHLSKEIDVAEGIDRRNPANRVTPDPSKLLIRDFVSSQITIKRRLLGGVAKLHDNVSNFLRKALVTDQRDIEILFLGQPWLSPIATIGRR